MVAKRSPRARKPVSPGRELLKLLWWIPLAALPFSVFFLLLQGAKWNLFPYYFLISLVFSAAINLVLWFSDQWVRPVLTRRFEADPRAAFYIAGTNLAMSLVGAVIALFVINATIVKGFIRGARDLMIGMLWSLLFGAAFVAIALIVRFYRKTVERAGSDRELQLARRIQRSFLLSEFPRRPRIECHAENVSSREVSGDFYDVVTPNDSEILLAIADVSGKGVPAALLSSMLQASLRTQAGAVASPAAIMRTMNSLACQRTSTGQFATFFLAAIHEPTMTLRYTNGGHNFPVLLRADGSRRTLEVGGTVIGMLEEMPFEEEAIELRTGDRLVVYTDGVTEAQRDDQEMFGEERLMALLESCPRDLPADQLVRRVLDGVGEFLGDTEPGDDITVMALRVLPQTP